MKRAIAILSLAGTLLASSAARSESTFINLDVAPGSFSMWKVSDLEAKGVDFDLTFVKPREHEKWRPVYAIELLDDQGKKSVVFKGTHLADGSIAPQIIVTKGPWEKSAYVEPLVRFSPNEKYAVKIRWAEGKITLSVGEEAKVYDLALEPTTVSILCSTGELQVEEIVFVR
jgi:hypothetical protein